MAATYTTKINPDLTKRFTDGPTAYTLDGAYIEAQRANRLALLPADQIWIEQSIDGGTTWTEMSVTDAAKKNLFMGIQDMGTLAIPLKNGYQSCDCMIRIYISGNKYTLASGETPVEDWDNDHKSSTERYWGGSDSFLDTWLNSRINKIYCKVEAQSGVTTDRTWTTIGESNLMNGWSGRGTVNTSISSLTGLGYTFGGNTVGSAFKWNWRITYRTQCGDGSFDDTSSTFKSDTVSQTILSIMAYSSSIWSASNNLMKNGHLYTWNNNGNATFTGNVTSNGIIYADNVKSKDGTVSYEKQSNKETTITNDSAKYPASSAVYSALSDKQAAPLIIEYNDSTTYNDCVTATNEGRDIYMKIQISSGAGTSYEYIPAALQMGNTTGSWQPLGFYFMNYIGFSSETFTLYSLNQNGWTQETKILENKSNKTSTLSSSSTDTQYPSAKCVYDSITYHKVDYITKTSDSSGNITLTAGAYNYFNNSSNISTIYVSEAGLYVSDKVTCTHLRIQANVSTAQTVYFGSSGNLIIGGTTTLTSSITIPVNTVADFEIIAYGVISPTYPGVVNATLSKCIGY